MVFGIAFKCTGIDMMSLLLGAAFLYPRWRMLVSAYWTWIGTNPSAFYSSSPACPPRSGILLVSFGTSSMRSMGNKVLTRFGTNFFLRNDEGLPSSTFSSSRTSCQTTYSLFKSPKPDEQPDTFRFENEQVLSLLW